MKVQCVLEAICFDYGKTRLPHIVERKGWECAESVELNRWVYVFLSNQNLFSPTQVRSLGKTLADLLSTIAQLRHTAVHRLRITTARKKKCTKSRCHLSMLGRIVVRDQTLVSSPTLRLWSIATSVPLFQTVFLKLSPRKRSGRIRNSIEVAQSVLDGKLTTCQCSERLGILIHI